MSNFNKISIKEAPAFYDWAVTDYHYFIGRPVVIGYHDEVFKTEGKYQTYIDSWERERTVQVITYNKYKIILRGSEHSGLQMLKYADYITIDMPNGEKHEAIILEMSERGETLNKLYEVVYYDVYKANYNDLQQPVHDFLRSDVLLARYSDSQLLQIKVVGGFATQYWYSLIKPILTNLLDEKRRDKVNGLNYTTWTARQTAWDCLFYMNEIDVNRFMQYLSYSQESSAGYMDVIYDGITRRSIELIEPNIQRIEQGIDLYKVQFVVKYSNTETIF